MMTNESFWWIWDSFHGTLHKLHKYVCLYASKCICACKMSMEDKTESWSARKHYKAAHLQKVRMCIYM